MRYIIIATDKNTRHTMYWGETREWHYNRGFAKRFSRKAADRVAFQMSTEDPTVIDVAVVPE